MPGTFPRHRLQRKPWVNDPSKHHGTCVTARAVVHAGIVNTRWREKVPSIPGACATRDFAYMAWGSWHAASSLRPLHKAHITTWQKTYLNTIVSRILKFVSHNSTVKILPNNKVNGANMGPMNFAIWAGKTPGSCLYQNRMILLSCSNKVNHVGTESALYNLTYVSWQTYECIFPCVY